MSKNDLNMTNSSCDEFTKRKYYGYYTECQNVINFVVNKK